MTDYEEMDKARLKWLRELGTSEPLPIAAFARGYFDALKAVAEIEITSARPEALPIPTSERLPEYQQNVLLWLVTVDPKNSGWVLGQRSSHEEGKFWDGERYRPMQWITHWKPLPAAPSIPSPPR